MVFGPFVCKKWTQKLAEAWDVPFGGGESRVAWFFSD